MTRRQARSSFDILFEQSDLQDRRRELERDLELLKDPVRNRREIERELAEIERRLPLLERELAEAKKREEEEWAEFPTLDEPCPLCQTRWGGPRSAKKRVGKRTGKRS